MANGLVAGVWALVGVIAFLGFAHFLTRPRAQTVSAGFDLVVAVVLGLLAGVAFIVAVTV
ncbi:hypothetical protein [Curtobacterium sp. MCBA15_004]|uniref:hypothetical protein n=1 Tax=Curtobacterium sp. MCBA15_004 TaxID=1898733 RepID=UPI0011150048|nr:hypothetical protein [Curtobacterium sp. MCBA15_004]WIA95834.1 hypothetical protein QOL16_12015 [Curtobacterium sp. MCBA15_004]